ncbi:hypothetical protein TNCV_1687811 [Trichonephila clavipes]|nr:hypothetical protein TNCV_1687811 [Trichonephila clavipes]
MYLQLLAADSRPVMGHDINSRTQSRGWKQVVWDDVLISNPVLSREESIININFPLQSACGEKFISTAGIALFPYMGSKCVKRHPSLPMKSARFGEDGQPKMSKRSTSRSRST